MNKNTLLVAFLVGFSGALLLSGCKFLQAESTWDKFHEICAADLFSATEVKAAAEARKITPADVADIICSSAFVLEPYIRNASTANKSIASGEALRIAKERGLL